MATEESRRMGKKGRRNGSHRNPTGADDVPGIVIAAGDEPSARNDRPRIAAFIWGGKVRPTPTLPFGRWKGVV